MTEQQAENIYGEALAVFGVHQQLRKLAEEASELATVALRILDGRAGAMRLCEEAADVEIVLGQLRVHLGSTINRQKTRKLKRLRAMLNDMPVIERLKEGLGEAAYPAEMVAREKAAELDKENNSLSAENLDLQNEVERYKSLFEEQVNDCAELHKKIEFALSYGNYLPDPVKEKLTERI